MHPFFFVQIIKLSFLFTSASWDPVIKRVEICTSFGVFFKKKLKLSTLVVVLFRISEKCVRCVSFPFLVLLNWNPGFYLLDPVRVTDWLTVAVLLVQGRRKSMQFFEDKQLFSLDYKFDLSPAVVNLLPAPSSSFSGLVSASFYSEEQNQTTPKPFVWSLD